MSIIMIYFLLLEGNRRKLYSYFYNALAFKVVHSHSLVPLVILVTVATGLTLSSLMFSTVTPAPHHMVHSDQQQLLCYNIVVIRAELDIDIELQTPTSDNYDKEEILGTDQ